MCQSVNCIIVRTTRSLRMTKIPFGFRSNLSMHGFVFPESRFIYLHRNYSLLEKPMSLITQSLNFNTSTHMIHILSLFLFVMNVNSEKNAKVLTKVQCFNISNHFSICHNACITLIFVCCILAICDERSTIYPV